MGKYKPYPPEDGVRSGCKVHWYYYRKREDADKAAEAAKWNASIQRDLGYDFGYCSPGSVELAHPSLKKFAGMWEVCLP